MVTSAAVDRALIEIVSGCMQYDSKLVQNGSRSGDKYIQKF